MKATCGNPKRKSNNPTGSAKPRLDTYIATKTIASFRPVNIVDSLETTVGFGAASCVVVTSGTGWFCDSYGCFSLAGES